MRQYEFSPRSKGVKVWEIMTAEMQKETIKVKFERLVYELCN